MGRLKLISLLIIIIAFLGGQANAAIKSDPLKKNFSGKVFVKCDHKITGDNPEDEFPTKRKRKAKCVEVEVPNISNISFEQLFTYHQLDTLWFERSYSFIEYYSHGKRGPPLN